MKKTIGLTLLLLFLTASCNAAPSLDYSWKELEDGLHYTKIIITVGEESAPRRTTLHAFKIDPEKFRIDVLIAAPDKKTGEKIDVIADREGAVVAVNGGFFTPEHKSIGLLVKSGTKINPLHNTSWWSVFAIHRNRPLILRPWQAKGTNDLQMAVQAGPRLVIDGSIPKFKSDQAASRTALGITKKGEVIIVASSGSGITMQALADRMRESARKGGLECPNAMALDGGSSTQLYANAGDIRLNLSGISRVPNGVGVFRK